MKTTRPILVPLDFSPVCRAVLGTARHLARSLGAPLVLLHVVKEPLVIPDYPGLFAETGDIVRASERAARAHLTKWRHELGHAGFDADQRVFVGVPACEILAEAKKLRAQYIVIGSHGHNAFYNFVVGSTAGAVLKEAPCPVVVVASPPAVHLARKRLPRDRSRKAA